MADITLKGNPIHTSGDLPAAGSAAPDFQLVDGNLATKGLGDFSGTKILNIFPSVDTPVCATSIRKFNEQAASKDGVSVLCISADLPFAQQRFCGAEGIEGVVSLSNFRDSDFGNDYGVTITDGPLAGLLARAVVVVDENGTITHSELVPEIAQEPDYAAALDKA